MARIRSIKPGFATDSKVARLSIPARLTFILLWPEADDEGRMVASPKRLAGLLYPNDDNIGPRQVEKWIGELEREGMVDLYTVDGTRYLNVCNFREHQKPQHPTASVFPRPPNPSGSGKPHDPLTNSAGADQEPFAPVVVVVGGEGEGGGGGEVVEKESSEDCSQRDSKIEDACLAIAQRRLERNGPKVNNPQAWVEKTKGSLMVEVAAYFIRHPEAKVHQAVSALDEASPHKAPSRNGAGDRPAYHQPFASRMAQ